MNNGITEVLASCEYDFDKFFEINKYAMWTLLISDFSYMEGYIKGLESSIERLKMQVEERRELI